MKKIVVISLFVFLSIHVHAAGAASAFFTALIYEQQVATEILDVIRFAKQLAETKQIFDNAVEQLDDMKNTTERALKNLKSVVDVKSYSDFMKWYNRQLYLEREVEYRYNRIGVTVDGKKYDLTKIDEIPGAMKNNLLDPFSSDFTEEEKREMFLSMGVTPGNYLYLKTWEQRNDAIAKNIRTYGEIQEEETEEAYSRNQNIIDKYKTSSEDLDINEISKEAHITAMNQEMLLRELIRKQNEMYEYELSRDRMAQTPPSPPIPSYIFNFDPYSSITRGHSQDNYHD